MRKLDNIIKKYQSFRPETFMHTKCEIKYDPKGVVLLLQNYQILQFETAFFSMRIRSESTRLCLIDKNTLIILNTTAPTLILSLTK